MTQTDQNKLTSALEVLEELATLAAQRLAGDDSDENETAMKEVIKVAVILASK